MNDPFDPKSWKLGNPDIEKFLSVHAQGKGMKKSTENWRTDPNHWKGKADEAEVSFGRQFGRKMNALDEEYWWDKLWRNNAREFNRHSDLKKVKEMELLCSSILHFIRDHKNDISYEAAGVFLKHAVHPKCRFQPDMESAISTNPSFRKKDVAVAIWYANRNDRTFCSFYPADGKRDGTYVIAAKRLDGLFRIAVVQSRYMADDLDVLKKLGIACEDQNRMNEKIQMWAEEIGTPPWRTLSDDWEPTWRDTE